MKCLIVDDEKVARELTVHMLDGLAVCVEAANGLEAIERFTCAHEAKEPFSIILMDISMPDMDGHAASKAIRQIEKALEIPVLKRVKLVMLTAHNTAKDAMQAIGHAQSAAFLVKPVTKDKLLGVVRQLGLLK